MMYRMLILVVLIVLPLAGCQQPMPPTATDLPTPTGAAPTSPPESSTPDAAPTPSVDPAFSAWLTEQAVPLYSTDEYDDLSDLEPLRAMIGDARIVGLGEGTHGTHEFYTMKNRLAIFLIREMGFEVLAVEGGWQSARLIDRAIRSDDFSAYIDDLEHNAIVSNQEWLDLLDVLAVYNASATDGDKVTFYGLDVVDPAESIAAVRDFLALIDTDEARTLADRYDDCLWLYDVTQYHDAPADIKSACRSSAGAVYDGLMEDHDAFTVSTSDEAFEEALVNARLVVQAEILWSLPDEHAARDELLAQNVIDLIESGDPDRRVIVWAHNAHVGVGDFEGWPVMGAYLRERFGSDYVTVGTFFGEGSFNSTLGGGARRSFFSGPPLEGSLEQALITVEHENFALNLTGLDTDDAQAAWLLDAHPARWIGNFYDPDHPEDYMTDLSLADAFDIAIFIQSATPSRDRR